MAYTVGFITNYIASLLESDVHLKNIEVMGEISNITYHKSGHIYFSMKEEGAVLSCVMYKNDARMLRARLATGDRIEARGRVALYAPRGQYQLVVRSIKAAGEGELFRRFNELKDRLEEKGMFDECYKRPLPSFVKRLGVVTSPTGAAVRDIINVATRRNPYVSIILCPALVQGVEAAESVASAIAALDSQGVDVIIMGRGGGSMEDLWAFNEEVVANAIFACNTPIISAVGHETDVTISDFVADLRAPTPSAAAEIAVFSYRDFINGMNRTRQRLSLSMERVLEIRRQKATALFRHLATLNPKKLVELKRTRTADIQKTMELLIKEKISIRREELKRVAAGLSALSPAARLSQGYSYVTDSQGKNIYSIKGLNIGEHLNIRMSDGTIETEITDI